MIVNMFKFIFAEVYFAASKILQLRKYFESPAGHCNKKFKSPEAISGRHWRPGEC